MSPSPAGVLFELKIDLIATLQSVAVVIIEVRRMAGTACTRGVVYHLPG